MITYKQVTSEQIHEVFSLYNKQGKHLNAEEIRNALYHHLAFMKALVVTAGDSGTVDRGRALPSRISGPTSILLSTSSTGTASDRRGTSARSFSPGFRLYCFWKTDHLTVGRLPIR